MVRGLFYLGHQWALVQLTGGDAYCIFGGQKIGSVGARVTAMTALTLTLSEPFDDMDGIHKIRSEKISMGSPQI